MDNCMTCASGKAGPQDDGICRPCWAEIFPPDGTIMTETTDSLKKKIASLEKERDKLYLDRCYLKSDIEIWRKQSKSHTAEIIKLRRENNALKGQLTDGE